MGQAGWDHEVDVLVVGSGKGALTGALSAHDMGAGDVLVIEKGDKIGGTSALSGGVIWIPRNRYSNAAGIDDTVDEARDYLKRTIPDDIRRDDMIDAYLENGPRMIDFLHERSHARYMPLTEYPDYHSHIPGAKFGRALEPEPLDSALLGDDNDIVSHSHQIWYLLNRIPLTLGEQKQILTRQKGWPLMVAKLLARYAFDLRWRRKTRYDRYRKVGGSGVARLYLSLRERNVPVWRNSAMTDLVRENGRVIGATVSQGGKVLRVRARKGVILGAGGFEQNQAMREKYLPAPTSREWSAGVPTNNGDAVNAGVAAGAATNLMGKAWWCMTANVPGEPRPRLIIIEKALPGCCLVNQAGKRFLNESQNYQTLVDKLYEAHSDANPCVPCWLVFDGRYRRDYIVGPLLTPATYPDWMFPRSWYEQGFLAKADSIAELAEKTGIEASGLAETVGKMNAYAQTGVDLDFHRGATEYDRYYGDPRVKPNPNLAPITEAPFYAMRISPGDIGTQGGLVTNVNGQVVGTDGEPVAGLYATGNCTAAVIPTYPGAGSTLGPAMVFAYQAAKHITGFNG
jgi:3-oxosteroid 1-dehydrogenase